MRYRLGTLWILLAVLLVWITAGIGFAVWNSDAREYPETSAIPAEASQPATESRTLSLRVTKAHDHLGHDIAEPDSDGGMHPVWIDATRGRLTDTGEEFVIWWNHNEIENTPFRFEDGKTYAIEYKDELEDGVMGYEGKCLHVGKLVAAPIKTARHPTGR
jgi:hypothetical protein